MFNNAAVSGRKVEMARVLIVDSHSAIRKWLSASLGEIGHQVDQATDGKTALETASREPIDLMLLDFDLPGMGGSQVLSNLKGNPRTRAIPVIMLTSIPSYETEAECLRLGASNVLTKPCDFEDLATHIRVALREGQETVKEEPSGEAPQDLAEWELPTDEALPDAQPALKASGRSSKFVSAGGGLAPLRLVLGGGLAAESLTLIEGPLDSGKGLICQYLMYGAIMEGSRVAVFSSDQTVEDLSREMGSMGRDVSEAVQDNKLSVQSISRPSPGVTPESYFGALASKIDCLPKACGLVVIDEITDLAMLCQDRTIMGFFSIFQKLCTGGKAIVVVAQAGAFAPDLLGRLHQLCDTHITMAVRDRQVKVLNAGKVNNLEQRKDNGFSFRIEPGVGAKVVPMFQVRI